MAVRMYALAMMLLPAIAAQSGAPRIAPAEDKDSYEIYSLLLRSEMPPDWKITTWTIGRQTRTYNFPPLGGSPDACVKLVSDQESTYRPLLEDYVSKNRKPIELERKFDLPEYALVGPADMESVAKRWPLHLDARVIFYVSAVGFNNQKTRALVYVEHNCGGLCGGGTYHFLIKTDGKWRIDEGFRGAICTWVS